MEKPEKEKQTKDINIPPPHPPGPAAAAQWEAAVRRGGQRRGEVRLGLLVPMTGHPGSASQDTLPAAMSIPSHCASLPPPPTGHPRACPGTQVPTPPPGLHSAHPRITWERLP